MKEQLVLSGDTATGKYLLSTAVMSPCGKYRYLLTRYWERGKALGFLMLNPSTADGMLDDPTIRRCVGFAKREGYAGIKVVNLFAFRASKPAELDRVADPVGKSNQDALKNLSCDKVVAAWGSFNVPEHVINDAVKILCDSGAKVVCLGTTRSGAPRHPLYVSGDTPLEPWTKS